MIFRRIGMAATTLGVATMAIAAPLTIDAMKWKCRILLVSTPSQQDAKAVLQRRIFAEWSRGAEDRDVVLIEVTGLRVSGASESAQAVRDCYHLRPDRFDVLLIGKDGHVADRSDAPIAADTLAGKIDAMPMRQAGQR